MLVARDQSQPNAVHMYAMFSKDGKNWSDRIFLTDLGVSYSSLAQFKNGKTIIAYCKELNKCKLYIRDVYKIPNLDRRLFSKLRKREYTPNFEWNHQEP